MFRKFGDFINLDPDWIRIRIRIRIQSIRIHITGFLDVFLLPYLDLASTFLKWIQIRPNEVDPRLIRIRIHNTALMMNKFGKE